MAAAQFMALGHPAAAAQAAFLSQTGLPPHLLPSSSPGGLGSSLAASLPSSRSSGLDRPGAAGGLQPGALEPQNLMKAAAASGLTSLEALQR